MLKFKARDLCEALCRVACIDIMSSEMTSQNSSEMTSQNIQTKVMHGGNSYISFLHFCVPCSCRRCVALPAVQVQHA